MFRLRHRLRTAVLIPLAVVLAASPASAAPPDLADGVAIYERDVFEIVGSALRHPDAGTDPSKPLFTDSGIALGITWGQWSAASATSRAQVKGHRTDVRLSLTGLVPNGLYTVFWGTLLPDSEQSRCPGVERTLPLDDPKPADPSAPNSFRAGADGTATFHGQTPGNLFAALQVWFSVVYRFADEATYPFPNRGELLTQGDNCRASYGADAMRHLLVLQKW